VRLPPWTANKARDSKRDNGKFGPRVATSV